MRSFLSYAFTFFMATSAWMAHAFYQGPAQGVSQSGKTIRINVGRLDRLADEEKGRLFVSNPKATQKSEEFLDLGMARVVKMYPRESIWYVDAPTEDSPTRSKAMELLGEGNNLIILTQSETLAGLGDLSKNRRKVILNQSGKDFALVKRENEYTPVAVATDYYTWEKNGEFARPRQEETSSRDEEIDANLKDRVFAKRSANALKNVQIIEDEKAKTSQGASKQNYIAEEKINKLGPEWSEDMSDEELTHFIHDRGVFEETKRRQRAASQLVSQQMEFSLSGSLSNSQNAGSDKTSQVNPYALTISYDYMLIRRYEKAAHWVAQASFLQNRQNIDAGNEQNAATSEFGIQGSLLWYPFQLPSGIDQNLFYLGLGLRFGQAKVSIGNQYGIYKTNAVPVFLTGLQYRMNPSWGFSLPLSLATVRYTSSDVISEDTRFKNDYVVHELNVGVGLNYYF